MKKSWLPEEIPLLFIRSVLSCLIRSPGISRSLPLQQTILLLLSKLYFNIKLCMLLRTRRQKSATGKTRTGQGMETGMKGKSKCHAHSPLSEQGLSLFLLSWS